MTKIAVARDSKKILSTAKIPGNMPSKASTPPTLLVKRTQHTGTRGVNLNKLNAIPYFLPQSQLVKGFEMYVSGSEKDPNYRIHTITHHESDN
jgi:hypothetical protein